LVNIQTKIEFDQYARDYFQELSHPLRNMIDPEGHYFIELKSLILQNLAARYFNDRPDIRIVDVGTGLGLFEKFLSPTFTNIMAIDISYEMINVAKAINPLQSASSAYVQGNAYHLPFEDNYADLIFMSCVLHHLENSEVESTLKEIARICSPAGHIVFFEHNPRNPFTQLVVRTTPLDKNARLVSYKKLEHASLSAGIRIESREFFLYGTRKIDTFINRCLPGMSSLPFGGQYALFGQKIVS
jgi:ubiquinone/menaquinone biosynthesis C-methylase UbiE